MAPILCKTTRTIYYPAPKSASSTMREVMFEIDNGFRFPGFKINGQPIDLFKLYENGEKFRPVEVPPGFELFTLIRDPIKRFVSFYKWGVMRNKCNFERHIDINAFVDHFEDYLDASPKVRFHLLPQFQFVGKDLAYYNRVFKVENLAELEAYLSARAGKEISIPRVNTTALLNQAPALTPQSVARLKDIYRQDYELLRGHYPAA